MARATSKLIREGVTATGNRVTLTLEQGSYFGAKPYFQVLRYQRTQPEHIDHSRYTPFEAIAEAYFDCFLRDVTDPEALKAARGQMPPLEQGLLDLAKERKRIAKEYGQILSEPA